MTLKDTVSKKFTNPDFTVEGVARATVPFSKLETLWFNTGSLCNIACVNCYMESTPRNNRLVYISRQEVLSYLNEIRGLGLDTRQIAFTGGEPFMNPEFLAILEDTLKYGFEVLVLTNAMRPMQRPRIQESLKKLQEQYPDTLVLRISLDHFSKEKHDLERGEGAWDKALVGIDWLSKNGFTFHLAGRTLWNEDETVSRAGYKTLIQQHSWRIDPDNKAQLVLFPEMSPEGEVPEISVKCWDILGVKPEQQMCATSRMVVKREDADKPVVLPCTLITYQPDFDMGRSLLESVEGESKMFKNGAVKLCHPYCAKFCVLGGGSCTVDEVSR